MRQPGLFLDRDGVVNVDIGHAHRIEQIEFVPGIFDLVKRANNLGYFVAIITNQAGIGKGFYSEEQFQTLTRWLLSTMQSNGAIINHVEFCPHHPLATVEKYRQVCECRKPKPGMIRKIAQMFELDLGQSVLVGDRQTDIEAGLSGGIKKLWYFDSKSGKPLEVADGYTSAAMFISSLDMVVL